MRSDLLKEYIKDDPDDPFLQYALGLEYIKTGQEEEALEQFRNVNVRFREYLPNYYQLGHLLISLGRTSEGLEILRTGLNVAITQKDSHTAGELRTLIEEYQPD